MYRKNKIFFVQTIKNKENTHTHNIYIYTCAHGKGTFMAFLLKQI